MCGEQGRLAHTLLLSHLDSKHDPSIHPIENTTPHQQSDQT